MAISSEFIGSLKSPKCIYCESIMTEHHSKIWSGMSWNYLAVEFVCNGNSDSTPPHRFIIRARTENEWKQHSEILNTFGK